MSFPGLEFTLAIPLLTACPTIRRLPGNRSSVERASDSATHHVLTPRTIRSASPPDWNPLALNLEYVGLFLPWPYHLKSCDRFATADIINRRRFKPMQFR